MNNGHGLPVLDRPAPRMRADDTPVALALNRCASGCKRTGNFQFDGAGLCDVCLSAAIVRAARGRR